MKFIKVKATNKQMQEIVFFLNTDLIKIIGLDRTVYLRNDLNDTNNEHLLIGEMEYVSIMIHEDISLDKLVL
jgi:hypothetical protein